MLIVSRPGAPAWAAAVASDWRALPRTSKRAGAKPVVVNRPQGEVLTKPGVARLPAGGARPGSAEPELVPQVRGGQLLARAGAGSATGWGRWPPRAGRRSDQSSTQVDPTTVDAWAASRRCRPRPRRGGPISRSGRRCSPRSPSPSGWRRSSSVSSISISLPGLPVPAMLKNAGPVAHPGGLLHVVGDDDDRVVLLELVRSGPRSPAWRSGRAPSTARPSAAPAARRRWRGRCTAAAAGRRTGSSRARRAGP